MSQRLLNQLRRFCLALPDACETNSWGHPNFRAGKKTFAVYEVYKGRSSIAVKLPPPEGERRLADARFYRTPYTGKNGWVSLWVDVPVPWTLVKELVLQSYREVASEKQLASLARPRPRKARKA